MKFKSRPVIIEAVQWKGNNLAEIMHFMEAKEINESFLDEKITIPTLEGDMVASKDDWIIKGLKGEFYPCKPDIFYMKYERTE